MRSADLVLANGKIATVDRNFSFAQAVAVKDGWIIDVGSTEEIKQHIGAHTQVVDLQGKLVLPGAHDCHTHACLAGVLHVPGFVNVMPDQVQSIQEICQKLKDAAEQTSKGEWIIGCGIQAAQLKELVAAGGRQITRHDIDAATPDHPVVLANSGLHHALLNTRALEAVGITKEFRPLERWEGHVVRDANGEPTGCIDDFMLQDLVGRHAKLLTDEQLQQGIRSIQAEMNRHGVTEHTEIAGIGGDYLFGGAAGSRAIEAYEAMERKGELTARVSVNMLAGLNGISSYDAIVGGAKAYVCPEIQDEAWLNVKAIKIFGESMWLRKGARKEGGASYFPGKTDEEQRAEMTRTIIELHKMGWQMGIHSTGGQGIDTIVDAYVAAMEQYPGKDLRHFVIHGDDFTEENMRKCAKHHIVLSSQAVAPYGFMERLVESIDPPDPCKLFDYQHYMDNGVIIAQGSDAPCMTTNWLKGLKFALTRKTVSGTDYNGRNGCRIEDAIRMYTINGAYQNHRDHIDGSIEVDKLADLQVLDADLFSMAPEDVDQAHVVMTFVGGKLVYQK